jgi:eukaryotic-like serine/threonine-protein kinase
VGSITPAPERIRLMGRSGCAHGEEEPGMVGELAMERFRLVERLGAGGMGTVYRAVDTRLQREVALKEIHGADTARVLREAKAAARLNHPAIVTLYEFGAQGNLAMLVSELAQGDPLDVLARDGEITDREVAWVGVQVCAALAHAHEKGVIHRDVKPQNIVVDVSVDPPRAKLMDFGIAAIAGEAPLTATGQVVGTLAYMSPEQAEGAGAESESDVYSIALTLYECWAGDNPVAAATPAATARRIGSSLPSLRDARPDLPELLVEVIDDCLVPEPQERAPLAELGAVLERCAEELDGEYGVPAQAGSPAPPRESARAERLAAPLGLALAPILAAVGLATAAPALTGYISRWRIRCCCGALAWAWLVVASVALGIGPSLGFTQHAAAGAATASQAVTALLDPASLAGAALFAAAAWATAPIVRTSHLSLALMGAILWGAGLDAGLRGLDITGISPSPLLPAGAAACLAIAAARPAARPREAEAPALG